MAAVFVSILAKACKSRPVTFDAGQTVFHQGDTVRWLYLIDEGRVRLSRVLGKGSEIALARVTGGEILAEASVFAPFYHCDAIVETESRASRYPMRDVLRALQSEPGAAVAYGTYLAGQLMDLRAMSEIRAIRRADDRLLAWLHMRAAGNPPKLDGLHAWPSIARQIGLTVESVYRALAALESRGKIIRTDGIVTLI